MRSFEVPNLDMALKIGRAPSQYKDHISNYVISIIRIRRSCDRLIFILSSLTLVRVCQRDRNIVTTVFTGSRLYEILRLYV